VSQGQRFTFLGIAVLIAVVAAIVLGTGGGDEETESAATQTSTPTATATSTAPEETTTPTPTPTPTAQPVPLLSPGDVKTIEFKRGQTVRFKVKSPTADHVHVHGYDVLKDVKAGGTVTFSFKATITGIFEIELEDAHTPVGNLRVNP
jgi:hypothetical protein